MKLQVSKTFGICYVLVKVRENKINKEKEEKKSWKGEVLRFGF